MHRCRSLFADRILDDTQRQVHVSRVKTAADGRITFSLRAPGRGSVDVLGTAWKDNLARAAVLLKPAADRFVFVRQHVHAAHGGTVSVTVTPDRRGRRLVAAPLPRRPAVVGHLYPERRVLRDGRLFRATSSGLLLQAQEHDGGQVAHGRPLQLTRRGQLPSARMRPARSEAVPQRAGYNERCSKSWAEHGNLYSDPQSVISQSQYARDVAVDLSLGK